MFVIICRDFPIQRLFTIIESSNIINAHAFHTAMQVLIIIVVTYLFHPLHRWNEWHTLYILMTMRVESVLNEWCAFVIYLTLNYSYCFEFLRNHQNSQDNVHIEHIYQFWEGVDIYFKCMGKVVVTFDWDLEEFW